MNTSLAARPNEALIDQNYERWLEDRGSVGTDWAAFFEGFELGYARSQKVGDALPDAPAAGAVAPSLQTRVDALVYAYRTMGHSMAHLDPLENEPRDNPLLSLRELGFSEKDLHSKFWSRSCRKDGKMSPGIVFAAFKSPYFATVALESNNVKNPKI